MTSLALCACLGALGALGCDDGGGTGSSGGATPGGSTGGGVTPGASPDGTMMVVFSTMEADLPENTGYFFDEGYGFEGAWFTYNDATAAATQEPMAGGKFVAAANDRAEGGSYAARTSGSGFTLWGAGMGFNLRVPAEATSPLAAEDQCMPATAGAPCTFDASMFAGIGFYAKLGAGASHPVRVKVVDAQVAEPANGGSCMAGSEMCNNGFGAQLALTSEWAFYKFTWADLAQEDYPSEKFSAVDPTQFIGVQFQAPKAVAFDIWVDDVAFLTTAE